MLKWNFEAGWLKRRVLHAYTWVKAPELAEKFHPLLVGGEREIYVLREWQTKRGCDLQGSSCRWPWSFIFVEPCFGTKWNCQSSLWWTLHLSLLGWGKILGRAKLWKNKNKPLPVVLRLFLTQIYLRPFSSSFGRHTGGEKSSNLEGHLLPSLLVYCHIFNF